LLVLHTYINEMHGSRSINKQYDLFDVAQYPFNSLIHTGYTAK
jgi:hypothetical protein